MGKSAALKSPASSPFMPRSLAVWLFNAAWRLLGLLVVALAVALALALLSYNPGDPTLNTVTEAPVQNLLGPVGANVADMLMQALGLAAYGLVLPVFLWGIKIIRVRWLPYFALNLAVLPVGVFLLATALAVPIPAADFPIQEGYGGALGQAVYGLLMRAAGGALILPEWVWLTALLVLALPIWAVSFALNKGEWATIGRLIVRLLKTGVRGLWIGLRTVVQLLRARGGSGTRDHREKPKRKRQTIARTDRGGEDSVTVPHPTKRVAAPKATKRGEREAKESQGALNLGDRGGAFQLPPLKLLTAPPAGHGKTRMSADALDSNARLLESVLDDFSIKGLIGPVRPGPVVTLYELEPARGTKSARVISLADDIARSMSAVSARVAVIPGQNAIGIELPNPERETVFLRELLASQNFEDTKARLPIILGKDIGGAPVVADLAAMPHLLVAGTTGSGKSVGINAMILSLLYRFSPDELKLIMVDPKMLELSMYDDIPHLLTPVVTEAKKAVVALKWAAREMEDRYRMMQKLGVKNQAGFNKKVLEARAKGVPLRRRLQTGFDKETGEPIYEVQDFDYEPLPYLVIVIDEMADLMLVAGKEVEGTVQRLAQMARAAGIHLIMATQRPSVDVITGTIKANFPTRISFQVTSKIDSRTILGEQGAEQLLGMGDMLYMAGGGRLTRVHGAFVSDNEVEDVVAHIKRQQAPSYQAEVTEEPEEGYGSAFIPGSSSPVQEKADSLYDQAVAIVVRDQKASTSYVQRRLRIGYNKAATLIEEMEEQGVISAPNHKGQRQVLVPNRDEDLGA